MNLELMRIPRTGTHTVIYCPMCQCPVVSHRTPIEAHAYACHRFEPATAIRKLMSEVGNEGMH